MKYNKEYDLYVTEDGLVFRYDLKTDRLVLKSTSYNKDGYERFHVNRKGNCKGTLVHRLVWETFNGNIPKGFEIDHINNIRSDNKLCNLQLITHVDNVRKAWKDIPRSNFSKIFMEKYGFIDSKSNLYSRQWYYYKRHGCLKE